MYCGVLIRLLPMVQPRARRYPSRYELPAVRIHDGDRVDGAHVAGEDHALPRHDLRHLAKPHDSLRIELERLRRQLDAVPETDAQSAVDADRQAVDRALLDIHRFAGVKVEAKRAC